MYKITRFFIYAFLLDGIFSVADVLYRRTTGEGYPSPLTFGWAMGVLILGFILSIGMILTPRLPKRLLLPLILFLGFEIIWGVMFGQRGEMLHSLAQVFIGLGVIGAFKPPSMPFWMVPDFSTGRPAFTWKNFFLTGLLMICLGAGLVTIVGLDLTQRARLTLEGYTGRYLTIQPQGISLEERRFRSGDKEIRLISMMHVARSGFYDDIVGSLPASASAMVLLEGVGDREHLMEGKLGYGNVAQMLGISAQEESAFTKKAREGLKETEANEANNEKPSKLEYQSGDIDISEFKPDTIRFIQTIGKLLQSSDLQETLRKYSQLHPELEQYSKGVYADILNKRNEHLLGEIQKALSTHTTIVVPWGAAHMPGIQSEIEKWGFKETKRRKYQAVHFKNSALVGLVWLLDRMPAEP